MVISKFVKIGFLFLFLVVLGGLLVVYLNTSKTSVSRQDSSEAQTTILKEENGKLVEGFPEFPIYPGSTIARSQYGTTAGKDTYVADLETTGQSLEAVMEWYEDEKLPEAWIYDEPLTVLPSGDRRIKVHQNGSPLRVTLTVTQEKQNLPVVISIFAVKNNDTNQ